MLRPFTGTLKSARRESASGLGLPFRTRARTGFHAELGAQEPHEIRSFRCARARMRTCAEIHEGSATESCTERLSPQLSKGPGRADVQKRYPRGARARQGTKSSTKNGTRVPSPSDKELSAAQSAPTSTAVLITLTSMFDRGSTQFLIEACPRRRIAHQLTSRSRHSERLISAKRT
ncbi:hypothetical protein D3C85_976010 [compost metagenome]